MLIRPQLQALRDNDAPQRLAQARMRAAFEGWLRGAGAAGLEAELDRYDHGGALAELPLLADLFAPGSERADRLVAGLVAIIAGQMAAEPLSLSPLRHGGSGALTSLVIARQGTASLALQAFTAQGLQKRASAQAVTFIPAETMQRVIAGQGSGRTFFAADRNPPGSALRWRAEELCRGSVQRRDGREEAFVLEAAEGNLVLLKLQRRHRCGTPSREYKIDDGSLVHQAAGTPRESRLELIASLLGRMDRRDAAPLLGAMAEEAGSAALRWQALRECLALDSGEGFLSLCRIAASSDDPLAVPAGALRAQLIERHPELTGADPCRA